MSLHQLQAHHDQRTDGAPRVPARAFFETALPLAFNLHDGRSARGRFAFDLTGQGGGAWTVDCATRAVSAQLLPADVVVKMPAASFEAMLKGGFDVERAEKDGVVALQGDRRALAGLVAVLAFAAAAGTPPRKPLERLLREPLPSSSNHSRSST